MKELFEPIFLRQIAGVFFFVFVLFCFLFFLFFVFCFLFLLFLFVFVFIQFVCFVCLFFVF